MNIAVTGGTGCLGRPLIDRLISDGTHTKLLVLPKDKSLNKKVELIVGGLDVADSLHELCKGCDIIFHLAGKVHTIPKTKAEEEDFFRINVEGTSNLLKAAKSNGVKRVVFYSTVGVYGIDADFHGDEKSPCNPTSAYAKSKFQAENLVLNSSKEGGPEGVVLRFPVVYGSFDRGNVAKLIKTIRRKIFVYFGDGNFLRSMISSKNAAEAAMLSAFSPVAANETFCVTDGSDYTMQELISVICDELDIGLRPLHLPMFMANMAGKGGDFLSNCLGIKFPIDSDRVRKLSSLLTFSSEKVRSVLGYKPIETLREGIKREIEWLYP